jgi:hypothetical protein
MGETDHRTGPEPHTPYWQPLAPGCPDSEPIKQTKGDHVLGYLVMPIKPAELQPLIALTMCRFEQVQGLHRGGRHLQAGKSSAGPIW